jgi:UrcA family protein
MTMTNIVKYGPRALLAATAGFAASSASANNSPVYVDAPPQAHVSYADLNLQSPAGRARLVRRIHSAAGSLCMTGSVESLEYLAGRVECYRVAVAGGVAQMNAIALRQ